MADNFEKAIKQGYAEIAGLEKTLTEFENWAKEVQKSMPPDVKERLNKEHPNIKLDEIFNRKVQTFNDLQDLKNFQDRYNF